MKTQKGFHLDNELLARFAALEELHGASFTRLMSAAALQYLFANPDGPDTIWMQAAVAMNNGKLTLADLPGWLQRHNHDISQHPTPNR